MLAPQDEGAGRESGRVVSGFIADAMPQNETVTVAA
jgi:hypothetical protein